MFWLEYFQIHITTKRCDLNLTKCEDYNTLIHRNICDFWNKKSPIFNAFLDQVQPKLKCPLNMHSIKISNATADLNFAARLPLDGYTWITTIKMFKSIAHVRHKKRLLFCLMSQNTITQSDHWLKKIGNFHKS